MSYPKRIKEHRVYLIAILVYLIYQGLSMLILPRMGWSFGMFSAIPPVIVAFYKGKRPGILAAVLTAVVNLVFARIFLKFYGIDPQMYSMMAGNIMTIMLSWFLGYFRDVIRELNQSREQIVKLNSTLEDRVQEKTEHLSVVVDDLMSSKAELSEMASLKDDFLNSLSHEIRTPLHIIRGMSDLLFVHPEIRANDELYRKVSMLYRSAYRLNDQIRDLLKLKEFQDVAVETVFDTASLDTILTHLSDWIEPMIDATLVVYSVDLQVDAAMTLYTDREKLEDCLKHLLRNAVKFTRAGFIRLICRLDGQTFIFEVEDSGVGIEPDKLAAIFEAFGQSRVGLDRTYQGLGLGLAIVKKYSQLLKGTVTVSSVLGRGSRFTASFPVSPERSTG